MPINAYKKSVNVLIDRKLPLMGEKGKLKSKENDLEVMDIYRVIIKNPRI